MKLKNTFEIPTSGDLTGSAPPLERVAPSTTPTVVPSFVVGPHQVNAFVSAYNYIRGALSKTSQNEVVTGGQHFSTGNISSMEIFHINHINIKRIEAILRILQNSHGDSTKVEYVVDPENPSIISLYVYLPNKAPGYTFKLNLVSKEEIGSGILKITRGYEGYGRILEEVVNGAGMRYHDNCIKFSIDFKGVNLGLVTLTEDPYCIEQALDTSSWVRISYGLQNKQQLFNHVINSKLFTLEGARLNEALENTHPNPYPELLEFQDEVRIEAAKRIIPLVMSTSQYKNLDRIISSFSRSSEVDALINAHLTKEVLSNKYKEAVSHFGKSEAEFKEALSSYMAANKMFDLEFVIFSNSPVSLCKKLSAFLG